MEKRELHTILKNIEGLISEQDAETLYRLAKANSGGAIVEIGSWKGKSTICLAKGSEEGNKDRVYAIDPHKGTPYHQGWIDTEPNFRQNIKKAGVEHLVVPLVMQSEQAIEGWNQPVGLLWIDGDHEYEYVKKDFMQWEPYLVVGGVIAFHDSLNFYYPGIRRVIREYVFKSNRFSKIGFGGSITYATKSAELSIVARLGKVMKLLLWHLITIRRTSKPTL